MSTSTGPALSPRTTSDPTASATPTARGRGGLCLFGAALVAGVALGVVDLFAQTHLPYPWADLANSSAVWAVAAFGLGLWAAHRVSLGRAALAGVVLLVVAVEAYYVAAVVVSMADTTVFTRTSSVLWALFAVVAGLVFAPAGVLARRGTGWLAAAGVAAAVGVLWGEAALALAQPGAFDDGYSRATSGTALITALLGVALLVVLTRRPASCARAALLAVPAAAVVLVGFKVAGF